VAIPRRFLDAIHGDPGNCVLVVGAGLSRSGVREGGGGIPDWDGLMRLMIDHLADADRCDEATLFALRNMLAEDPPRYTEIAEEFSTCHSHDRDGYETFLRSVLMPDDLTDSDVHRLILRTGFRGIVSFNFDNVFEHQSGRLHPIVYPELLEQIGQFQRRGFFAKIHGSIDRPATSLILTKSSYEQLRRHPNYSDLLRNLFLNNKVLCVGFSMRDPAFLGVLQDLKERWGSDFPPLFALMQEREAVHRREWLAKGVDMMPFADYSEVAQFFVDLSSSQLSATRPPPTSEVATEEPPGSSLQGRRQPPKERRGITAAYAEISAEHGLKNQLLRRALLQGWIGPLLVLWLAGETSFLFYWQTWFCAGLWTLAAGAIGVFMLVNELRSPDVAREALARSVERNLEIKDLGSPRHVEELTRNIATFAEVAVGVRVIGPGRIRDPFLAHALENMCKLLAVQSEAAHSTELTRELELSPEVCAGFKAAWQQLSEQSRGVADGGPRFGMDFFGATVETLDRIPSLLISGGEVKTSVAVAALQAAGVEPDAAASLDSQQDDLVVMTGAALRRLRNPAALAQSGLIARLPRTLLAMRAETPGSPVNGAAMTRLDQARLLYATMVRAIDKLNVGDGRTSGEPTVEQYLVLHDKYVLNRPIKVILTRYSMAEATFHRHRRNGTSAIAADLAAQEENLARDAATASKRIPPSKAISP